MLKLFGAVCLLWLVIAMAQQSAVLDTAGQAVEPGVPYYILPRTGIEGPVTLVNRTGSCPLYVGQEARDRAKGLPVLFNPFVSDESIIRELNNFAISFLGSSSCNQPTDWALDRDSASGGRVLIRTAQENAPSDFFRIERDGDAYKLNYCPADVCPTCRFRCGDVGVSVENEIRLLAVYVPVLSVVFRRA